MTENQHLISIIMPVRDTENYVGETLDSIVNQSFQNWELIAVNDNSSDNSLGVMLPYTSDKRIKIVSNPNPGLLNALRYGYSKASGTIIHRMDSDDLMPKNKLERMMEAWKIHGKGCVITGGVEYFIDQDDNLLVNEIAPRVHNSGHLTINAFNVSQFENHIRAVCDLKMKPIKKISNAEMNNILGSEIKKFRKRSYSDKEFFFDYQKKEIKDKRKMGHLTILKG